MTPRQEADAARREVVRLLKEAGERCRRIILNPPGRTERAQNFYASRAAQQLASLNGELDALSSRVVGTAAKGIAAAYQQGLRDAEQQAREAGVRPSDSPLTGGFNVVDRRRAQVLVDQTVGDVHKAVISMRENTGKIVRQTQALHLDTNDVNRLLAGGTIEGTPRQTLNALRQMVAKAAIDGQIITVNTRTGVVMHFKPEDYADLVMQTKSAETATAGLMERLQTRGIHYVKVIGSNSVNFCTTFVGKVFYIGPGEDPAGRYPSSRTLPRGGPPFHVRCTKRFVAFVISLATPDQLKAAELAPHQREFLGLDDRAAGKLYRERERGKRAAAAATAAKATPLAEEDDLVTVQPATAGSSGERIIGPPDLLANAKDFLERQTREWAAGVTPDEAAALARYQSYGVGYKRINEALRTNELPTGTELEKFQRTVADLDRVIAKGGVPFDLPVARSIRGTDRLLDAWRGVAGTPLPWTEYGYLSTSLTQRGADEFVGQAKQPVIFSFVVPARTPFAYPTAVTGQAAHQLELLLGRGCKFLIRSVRADGKITRVEAELKRYE